MSAPCLHQAGLLTNNARLGLTGATTAMPALSLAAMRAFLAVSATDGLVLFLLALLTSASLVFRSLFGSKRWSDAFKKKEKRKKEQEQVKIVVAKQQYLGQEQHTSLTVHHSCHDDKITGRRRTLDDLLHAEFFSFQTTA